VATLAVFGGSGRTGCHVIGQALEAGHTVRVLARSADSILASGARSTVLEGDVLDPAAVDRVGWVGVDSGTTVARADLAGFLLRQVDDRSFIHQLPMVGS
jgi:nucleoside-diphosphate-sugar epimerase